MYSNIFNIIILYLLIGPVPKYLNHKSFINETCVGSSHVFIYKTFASCNFGIGLLIVENPKMIFKNSIYFFIFRKI